MKRFKNKRLLVLNQEIIGFVTIYNDVLMEKQSLCGVLTIYNDLMMQKQ